jgi:cephalosporin hydroxylase
MEVEVARDHEFDEHNREMIRAMVADRELRSTSADWLQRSFTYEYSYHFEWLGVPIIQYPQDIIAIQEVIWRTRPKVVIETGVARGGSVVLYASLMRLLGGERKVIGIDIEIRPHNRAAIESHPIADMVTLIDGSSTDPETIAGVEDAAGELSPVMVVLDSNHTHDHVLRELELYRRFVTPGCYLVVFDTLIEELPEEHSDSRPWGPGNNPATAIREFLASSGRDFFVDEQVTDRLGITAARNGYLRRA